MGQAVGRAKRAGSGTEWARRLQARARGKTRQVRGRTHGRAAGGAAVVAGRTAWALGAQPVRTGWASLVLVHPAWFSTWFFDSVFFLSHQMNTVHCKINFEN